MTQELLQEKPQESSSQHHVRKQSKIRIAYVVGALREAGTERQVLELIRHLDREQFELFLIMTEDVGAEKASGIVSSLFSMGIPDAGNSRWLRRGTSFIRAIFRTSRHLQNWRCDIVHAFLPGPCILAGAAGRIAKTPVVIGSRRSLLSQYRAHKIVGGWADTAALRSATYNLGNSRAVTDEMIAIGHCPPTKCATIPNGVDIEKFGPVASPEVRARLGWTQNEIILGLVGNFRECKRHTDFVNAAALIARECPPARFLMVGADSGTRAMVQQQVTALGLQTKTRILESTPAPESIFSALDIYVCTSSAEGFSNAVLEAMASGKPVIATRVGGNPEAVIDGQTGFLVPPFSPTAVVNAARQLLSNPALRREFGMQSRKRVIEFFSLQAMVDAHKRLYSRLTAESLLKAA
jgi:glycosyltransferase involved in cell wall biosynthesis